MRTRVGYAGGSTPSPTYHDLADHSEAFQLDYDPRKITYGELLRMFWTSHKPQRSAGSPQYMAAVFASPAQEAEALASRAAIESAATPVITGERARFVLAEDYHQKHYLRHHALMKELDGYDPRTFVESTVAARLNGYIGSRTGRRERAQLVEELPALGISERGAKMLQDLVSER